MTTIENTGELHLLADQLDRIKHDPRRPGPLDFVLAVGASAALMTFGVCLVILTMASDHYPVERGRVVLTLAAAALIVAPVMGMGFALNRAQRRRFDATMCRMEQLAGRIRCDIGDRAAQPLSPGEYFKVYSDAMKDLGDLADPPTT